MKSMVNGFYRNLSLFDRSKNKIFNVLKGFSDTIDKAYLLNTLKQLYMNYNKNTDKSFTHFYAKMTLDFISNYLFELDIDIKYLPYLVEMLVYSLSTNDIKKLAESIIQQCMKKVTKEELLKVFELELINSSKLYQIFSNWLETQNVFKVTSSIQKDNNLAEIMIQEETSACMVDDSFSQPKQTSTLPTQRNSPATTRINQYQYQYQNIISDELHDIGSSHTRESYNNGDTGINLMTEEKLDRLDLGSTYEKTAEHKFHLSNCTDRELEFLDYKQMQYSPFGIENRNPLLMTSNNTNKLPNSNMASEKPVLRTKQAFKIANLQESDEKWRNKYLGEKERLQQTIELLEKANHGYLSQVTEKVDIVSRLENQRKINEKLIEKFNG